MIARLPQRLPAPPAQLLRWVLVAAFFLLWAVIQTWPLVLHAGNSLSYWPVRPEDSWMNLWNLWWVKHALFSFSNPFHTDLLFYPQGADLYLHTLNTVDAVLSIPLQLLTGNIILSWNILGLLLFAASGVATYALAYRFTKNDAASLIAGFIFAFAPFVVMRFHGHWNIATVWPLPVFALFLFRFQERGRWWDAAAAGAAWAIIAYTNLEYAVDAGMFLGLFLLYWSLVYARAREWPRLLPLWRVVPIAVAALFVVGGPLLVPALISIRRNEVSMPVASESMSSDLGALFTPSPLWGPGKVPTWDLGSLQHFPTGDIENTVYLGITPLLLAAVALAQVRRLSHVQVFWAAVLLFFVSLAMGPHLYLGDNKDFSLLGLHFTVPMPYQLYEKIPLIKERRGIARLIVFGYLALSILAAMGAAAILSWLRGHYLKLVPLAAVLLFAFVAVEYWNPPQVTARLETPAALVAISREAGDFAVLDAPLGRSTWTLGGTQAGAIMADYYQRIYQKPSLGGYISRAPNETLFWVDTPPGIKYLACPALCPARPDADDLNAALVQETFLKYRIKYVALHYVTPHGWLVGGEELKRLDGYIRTVLGFREVYADSAFTLFADPDFPAPDSVAAP
ncbi:MAG: hypothetical protein Q7T33_05650 [Dehalococcoidia bacterium]|nr:hypothetical protein [Dehalococcoidia bacterium]